MEVEFADPKLDRLETDHGVTLGWAAGVVKAYRMRLQFIRSAKDEGDLRAFVSWHFKKLKGNRQHQYSIRLNLQYRLIVEIVEGDGDKLVRIIGIEDYH